MPSARLPLVLPGLLLAAAAVRADLGTLRFKDERATVFTSPAPLRAGPVEVKVLLPGAPAAVRVRAVQGGTRLEAWARGDGPFHVALLELPRGGEWLFQIETEGYQAEFLAGAAEPMPTWRALAPWLAWPAIPILLFVIHQRLARRGVPRHGIE